MLGTPPGHPRAVRLPRLSNEKMSRIECPRPGADALRAIAYHEAGHVAVGGRLGLRLLSTDIVPDQEGGNAHTQFAAPEAWFQPKAGALTPRERDLVERVVTTFMAGFGAELRSGGADPDGSGWDVDQTLREWITYLEPDPERRPELAGKFFARAQEELARPDVWRDVEDIAAALLRRRRLDATEVLDLVQRN